MSNLRHPLLVLVAVISVAVASWARAEPPSRAARLAYVGGTVSFSPAGEPDWVEAVMNRPLTTGDRLWSAARSRAELQLGGASIRLGAATSVTLLNLDDHIAQLQLSQGTLIVRVRHIEADQAFEVDTPNLALTLHRPGEYRIEVDPNADATAVTVQRGQAEVYGDDAAYAVNPQQGYRFYGTGLSDYAPLGPPREDDLDRWARDRDRRDDNSASARFVSPDVVGYEDLDANGTWRFDPNYGNVWTPTRVAAGWTPYRDGHWVWMDPWGWTWVDDAPWGFAVSHYGRWANIGDSWAWVPGPPREAAVYAPALVAFVGGADFRVSAAIGSIAAAAVGWFPLAPREVYQPSYPVSRRYFDNINRSNAVIAPTILTNVYNTTHVTNNTTIVNNTSNLTKVVYVNQQVTGAVVAVPARAFAQSQSVAKAALPVTRQEALSGLVVHVARVAPVQQSVHGGAAEAVAKPPALEQAVVARTAPPPLPVPFAAQQKLLDAKPGMTIDKAQRTQLKPDIATAPAAKVSVVSTDHVPPATALPPPIPPAGRSPDARRAEASKADAARVDSAHGDARQTVGTKAASIPAEAAKATAAKAEAARADASRAEAARADAARANAERADSAKAAAAKAEAAKADAIKGEAARAGAARAATPPPAVKAPKPEPDAKALTPEERKKKAEEETLKR
ncbi:MAG: FecR domain-containing protein [Burkholderiales bacterium]|nr:FecR domain-containing protein [Burkholderiales bacterium]